MIFVFLFLTDFTLKWRQSLCSSMWMDGPFLSSANGPVLFFSWLSNFPLYISTTSLSVVFKLNLCYKLAYSTLIILFLMYSSRIFSQGYSHLTTITVSIEGKCTILKIPLCCGFLVTYSSTFNSCQSLIYHQSLWLCLFKTPIQLQITQYVTAWDWRSSVSTTSLQITQLVCINTFKTWNTIDIKLASDE